MELLVPLLLGSAAVLSSMGWVCVRERARRERAIASVLDPTRDPGEIERREVQDPRGPILVRWYGDGRVEATARAPTELEGGPPSAHLVLAPRPTGDPFFDRAWAVTRGALCCTGDLRRSILAARPLVVRFGSGRVWVSGLSRQHGEHQLVDVLRQVRAAVAPDEAEGARRSAVDDPAPEVRVRAWDRLVELDPDAARAAWASARTCGDPWLRVEAGRRLGDEGLLLSVATDPSARAHARRLALGELTTPSACVLAIDSLLRSDDPDLRRHALRRLRRLEGPRALESALAPWTIGLSTGWTPDEQELLARQTARLLRSHPEHILPDGLLMRFLAFGDLRDVALRELAARGSPTLVPRLRLLQDLDPGGAAELERVVDAIHARYGGAGTLAMAGPDGGGLALAEATGHLALVE